MILEAKYACPSLRRTLLVTAEDEIAKGGDEGVA
jgi:hypothetical protein